MKNVLICVLLAAILLAGCTGGEQKGNASGTPIGGGGAPAGGGAAGGGSAAGGDSAAGGTQNGGGTPSHDGGSQPSQSPFDAFIGLSGLGREYMVEYNVSASGQESTLTEWVKGDKFKMKTTMEGIESLIFVLGNDTYSCVSSQQMPVTCTKSQAAFGATPAANGDEMKSDPANYEVKALPDRTVAGVNAKCFSVVTKQAKGGGSSITGVPVETCLSAEGVPLYQSIPGMTSMEATSYQKSVADSEFVLPATPR